MQVALGDLMFALSMSLDCVERQLLGVTSNHGKRTALLSMRLCQALGIDEADTFDMATCAVLHDNALTAYMLEAGPESTIFKLEAFKKHCQKGEDNAKSFPYFGDTSGIILYHHEKWDGTGYHGQSGEAIPLRAAILGLVDNMDLRLSLGSGLPDMDELMATHVRDLCGTHYAPVVVEAMLGLLNKKLIHELADEHIDATLVEALPAARIELSMEQLLAMCKVFAVIIDAKSPFTLRHSTGLAHKVRQMADDLGFDAERKDKMTVAAFLHDVGKLSTPISILEKPGPLSHSEFEIMKDHVAMTWRILEPVRGLEEIVFWGACHHEKLDGHGYPRGYTDKDLPLECRLMGCCDIYQALTEDRPYRKGLNHANSMHIMSKMAAEGKIDAFLVERMNIVMPESPGTATE